MFQKVNATMFLEKDTMLWLKVTMTMYSYCLPFLILEKLCCKSECYYVLRKGYYVMINAYYDYV